MTAMPGITPLAASPAMGVTPRAATDAYARVGLGQSEAAGVARSGADSGGFGAALQQAFTGVVDAGHAADAQAKIAITEGGNMTEVVSAIAKAELALQTTMAVRDRVVQAYQDIMRMPI